MNIVQVMNQRLFLACNYLIVLAPFVLKIPLVTELSLQLCQK